MSLAGQGSLFGEGGQEEGWVGPEGEGSCLRGTGVMAGGQTD